MQSRQAETPAGRAWTESQEQAITVRGKDILVSAAAGAGKTSVLVERIVRRLLDPERPVDIDRLLVVTFTESAAQEMKERVRARLEAAALDGDERAAGQLALLGKAAISTLHSFSLDLVRRYAYLLGVDPRFRVLDEEEANLLKLEAMEELFEAVHEGRDEALRPLVDHYAGRRDDRDLRALVDSLFEYTRSLPDGEEWLKRAVLAYDSSHPEGEAAWRRWKEAVLHDARTDLEQALSALDQAARLAQHPEGPAGYIPSLEAERLALAEAVAELEAGDWERAAAALAAVEFPRLPADKGSSPALREEAKAARDEAKKIVNRLRKGLFSRTEASYREDVARLLPAVRALAGLVREFSRRYRALKAAAGGLDFADLERLALEALAHPSGRPLAECRRRFIEVLVDEYQDINPVQDRLITLVSRAEEGEGNRVLVGDVKQSIYRFRLADPRIFQEKHRAFGGARDGGSVRIDLQANFRSRREILEGVNFLFRQLMYPAAAEIDYDDAAMLRPGLDREERELDPVRIEVHLVERAPGEYSAGPEGEGPEGGEEAQDGTGAPGEDEARDLSAVEREAALAGQLILGLVREGLPGGGEPLRFRDIVVLMRALKGRATRFVEVLESMGVPAHSSGGSGYFRAVEVQVVMALLRLIDNPRQDVPLAAVLYSPICGFDERDLAQVRAAHPALPFHAAAMEYAKGEGELARRLAAFFQKLERWRSAARRMPLSRLVGMVYDESGYLDYVAALPRGRQREANLLALWQRARHFDLFATSGLDRFIRHVDRLEEAGEDAAPAAALGEGEDVVRVMSVHQSKGLEFPVVILADLDREFNKADSRRPLIYHRDLGIGAKVVDREAKVSYPSLAHRAVTGTLDREAVAEELRLLYVALTRAKEKLILIGSARDLARRSARAADAARVCGWHLPQGRVVRARSWLDWILAGLARHRDGLPIRELGAGALGAGFYAPVDPEVESHPARFTVRCWTGEEAAQLAPGSWEREEGLPWAALARHEPTGEPEGTAAEAETVRVLEAVHGWRYPHPAAIQQPAKVSVTELARRFSMEEESEAEGVFGPDGPSLARPARFSRRRLSAAERGLAVHAFLAKIDLRDVSPAGLAAQLERLRDSGLLSQEEASEIDLAALARFFDSPLGRTIRAAAADGGDSRRLWRELPFTMRLSARGFASRALEDAAAPGEMVVVQGVIDCLVREGNRFLVIDYKTDAVRPGEEERAAPRYAWQVRLYREFVARSAQTRAVHGFLVFLQTGRALEIEGGGGEPQWKAPS